MEYKYISFDVYDTLIMRLYPVDEIYSMMSEYILQNTQINIERFKEKRILAEKELIKQNVECYKLVDIYKTSYFNKLSDSERNFLIHLEEEFEVHNTYSKYSGKVLYEKYKKINAKIICISDMYLSSFVIHRILNLNGYYPDRVYVSCECGVSKRNKKIYKLVCSDLKIKSNEIMHIGDAVRSDFINAKLMGIHSKLQSKKGHISDNYYFNLGFEIFGCIIFEFIKWIYLHSNDTTLVFLAREGDFLKKCYDLMYSKNSKLMYVSRKAVISSTSEVILAHESFSDLISIISLKNNEKVVDLFGRLGLQLKKYRQQLEDLNISEQDFVNKSVIEKLEKFFKSNSLQLLADMKNQQILFKKYMDQNLSDYIKATFVDIGWRGSMQELIQKYIEYTSIDVDINGLYFGVMDCNNKSGFLFEENNDLCNNILCFSGLMEIIMMPNYGSVIGYKRKGNSIEPLFDRSEFSEKTKKIIAAIQSGILEYLKAADYFKNVNAIKIEDKIKDFIIWGSKPKIRDIKNLWFLEFYDNGEYKTLIQPVYIKDLLNLKEIKRKFLESKWKSGFLKKMFKINFPYNLVINFFRNKMS